MSKRKLTQNQTRRIQSNNAKALHRHKKKEVEWQDDMLGESQDGIVVTRYSVHADAERDYWMSAQETLEYGFIDEIMANNSLS